MKKIIKITMLITFCMIFITAIADVFYATITGEKEVPYLLGMIILWSFVVLLLCICGLMWLERKSLIKELTEIINS